MMKPKPLPLTPGEFDDWAENLITGAIIVKLDDEKKFRETAKFALASMIMTLGPTESHKPDAFFIHSLRKGICNQVAHAYIMEVKAKQDVEKKAAEDAALALKAQEEANRDVLEVQELQGAPKDVVPVT